MTLMRWVLISVNMLMALAFFFLGSAGVAAHRSHAYSVYRELQDQHVLVERADYDVEARLENIAAGGGYSLFLSRLAAGACAANAIAIAIFFRKPRRDA